MEGVANEGEKSSSVWCCWSRRVHVLGGCSHGTGIELGAFGSSLKSDDLGQGYGGGAKLELKPIDWLSVDGRAS